MHPVLSVSSSPAAIVLSISGELDLAFRDELRHCLAEAERLNGASLDLDASGVSYIDASCLRVIDEARQRAEAGGRCFRVTAASPSFALVSDLAGYTRLAASDGPCSPTTSTATS